MCIRDRVCTTSKDFENVRKPVLLILCKCKLFMMTTHLIHLLLSSIWDFTDSNLFFSFIIVVTFSCIRKIPPVFGFNARQAVLQYSWQDGINPKLTWSATPTGQTYNIVTVFKFYIRLIGEVQENQIDYVLITGRRREMI